MSGNQDTTTSDADSEDQSGRTSRRRLLQAIGGVSSVTTLTGLVSAQAIPTRDRGTETRTETSGTESPTASLEATPVVLGGRVPYWLGLAPSGIESQQNPTVQLRSGEQYQLIWVNLDGERHQWQIEDEEGNVLHRTDPASNVGATRSVTFEATDQLAQYRCRFHPEQMQGTIELGEGVQTPTNGEQTGSPTGGETVDVAVGPEGRELRFVPETVEISVGDTVRWTAESPGHNVSFKPEADRKVQLPDGAEPFATYEGNRSFAIMEVGETFEHTFTVPGTYVYVCVPHADQGMIGQVTVTE